MPNWKYCKQTHQIFEFLIKHQEFFDREGKNAELLLYEYDKEKKEPIEAAKAIEALEQREKTR